MFQPKSHDRLDLLMNCSCLIVTLVAALCASPIMAQESVAPNTPFHEERFERAKVSGGLVVGAMFTPDSLERSRPSLSTALPATETAFDTVCLRVTSRDGTYESENTYSVRDAIRRTVLNFDYPTRFPAILRTAPTVARMNAGDCDREGPIIPVIWGEADDSSRGRLLFYVNTAGADTFVAYEAAGGEVVDRCAQVEETGGIKYTAVCPVETGSLPRDTAVTVYFDVTRNRVVETYEVEVSIAGK
jgi:hypothetical protein